MPGGRQLLDGTAHRDAADRVDGRELRLRGDLVVGGIDTGVYRLLEVIHHLLVERDERLLRQLHTRKPSQRGTVPAPWCPGHRCPDCRRPGHRWPSHCDAQVTGFQVGASVARGTPGAGRPDRRGSLPLSTELRASNESRASIVPRASSGSRTSFPAAHSAESYGWEKNSCE